MNRRHLLTGAMAFASLGAAPLVRADNRAERLFRILRGGSDIGRHQLAVTPGAEGLEVAIDIDIRVRVLGITAYRYSLTNREVWKDGALVRLDSQTDDDGTDERVTLRRSGDLLEIDGTGYSGTAPISAATTSYYAPDFVTRRPWISTQSGQPLDIATEVRNGGSLKRVIVTGDLEKTIVYDANGEWVASEFDAGGEPARYEVIEQSGRIAALWQSA
ncbi:MAG: DUF6134 family protein [Pseudomonadota bacterium]